MKTKTELLEEKLARGEILLGTQCHIANIKAIDILSSLDYDTIWIEMEHNLIDAEALSMLLFVIAQRKAASIIRVVDNEPSTVKPLLDMGVDGIIFPNVKDADEAAQCVAAATYPPDGIRGYAPGRGALLYGKITPNEYIQHNAKKIWKIIQVEDYRAVERIEEIMAVPGVSAILIGPWDMSGSMGVLNQTDDPELKKVFDRLMEKARKTDIPVAVCCMPYQAPEWLARGAKWLHMGADSFFIASGGNVLYESIQEMVRNAQGK